MIKYTILFLVTFALGCMIALAARTAMHKPHAGHADATAAPEYAPMVGNPSGHDMAAATAPAPATPATTPPAGKPVNSICAICGMAVDPAVPTAIYQGKTIGFGCKACPPKFAADPAKYGPYALRNEQAPE